jgi:hypothetical protein
MRAQIKCNGTVVSYCRADQLLAGDGWKVAAFELFMPEAEQSVRNMKNILADLEGIPLEQIVLGGYWADREAKESVKQ